MKLITIVLKPLLVMTALVAATGSQAWADEALARQAGCLNCHSVSETRVGPSYKNVAARYRNSPGAIDTLSDKVSEGGKGNWLQQTGGVRMPPHSNLLSKEEIRTLIGWILNQ
jgi:cytochrome c